MHELKKLYFSLFASCLASVILGATLQNRDAPVAPASSYSSPAKSPAPAPSSSYDAGDQANMYYYYHPAANEYGYETADAGYDIFTSLVVPLLILGGILLGLSSLTFTFTNGRAVQERQPIDYLKDEIERIFYIYLNVFEDEQCVKRTVCEAGLSVRDYRVTPFFISLVEPFIPHTMSNNVEVFKKAALKGKGLDKCSHKYRCKRPKL